MRIKRMPLLALMLCVGALLFSIPAYATNAPTTNHPIQTDEPVPDQTPEPDAGSLNTLAPEPSKSFVPQTAFTPDGTGTVMDNAVNDDGKEFFTIKANDGAVFYLVIDRSRTSENVYFLNAVTENDLLSLAKPGDGTSESAVPGGSGQSTPPSEITPGPKASPEPTPTQSSGTGSVSAGAIVFILIAVVAVGGAGYYFKVYKPKHDTPPDDESEEYDDEPDGDDEELEFEEGDDDK